MTAASDHTSQSLDSTSEVTAATKQQGKDHTVSHRHRLSLRSYPDDCPPLSVRWFHAIDIPKRKATYGTTASSGAKPTGSPKKYLAFSVKDSRAIETAFQNMSEDEERAEHLKLSDAASNVSSESKPAAQSHNSAEEALPSVKVAVNEDYLFDVDITNRELGPAYWLGPVYSVRRGTWFFQDGSNLKPCEENLAVQLEEGYLKTKPWTVSSSQQRSASHPRVPSESIPQRVAEELNAQLANSNPVTRRQSVESLTEKPNIEETLISENNENAKITQPQQLLTYRLFGQYMNSLVTYQDASTAWIVSDDFLSRMTGTMYQRFAGGAHFSGTKIIRGYTEPAKKRPTKDSKGTTSSPSADFGAFQISGRSGRSAMRRSAPANSSSVEVDSSPQREVSENTTENPPESHVKNLERQISSLATQDPEEREEEVRKREEQEMRDDYREVEGDEQDRTVEHLVLITHGIGQRLGARFESFNFIHDVNELRKTLKAVYASSEDLQALNAEIDTLPMNCRIQVLPICWRHLLTFPKLRAKTTRMEQDLGDADSGDEQQYPSLEDITIEGVPALRNIVSDLALDVLLYQTPVYRDLISRLVAGECNKIYKLFKQRNPTFSGKVSLIGHSLGSAVMFDCLCEQQPETAAFGKITRSQRAEELDLKLDFEVDAFFCFGSPLGLFQMLGGRKIAARSNPNSVTLDGEIDSISDPFENSSYSEPPQKRATVKTHHDDTVSSPKCKSLYNIFHPSDPISYRLEPLVSSEMATLKPQLLPYTKKGLFGAPMGQGLTGIPARVGQGFSGLWSSFSTGIATSLLNKSLGISAEDAAKLNQPSRPDNYAISQSVGAGTNISGGVVSENLTAEMSAKIMLSDSKQHAQHGGVEHQPTLIDGEIETLWGGFQQRKKSLQESDASHFGDNAIWNDADMRGRKLRREEAKVRALNSTGRIDFSIQEGAFDISFLASIASHLAYWQDEDVAHFVISQLLSHQRLVKRSQSRSRSIGQVS